MAPTSAGMLAHGYLKARERSHAMTAIMSANGSRSRSHRRHFGGKRLLGPSDGEGEVFVDIDRAA